MSILSLTTTEVKVNGTTQALPQTIIPRRCVTYVRNGIETFTFEVHGGAPIGGMSDPFIEKTITVKINGTLIFTGNVPRKDHQFAQFGNTRVYTAFGLRHLMDYVPHSDSFTGLDSSAYNQSADNQGFDYIAARAGRTHGQILADVLEMTTNADNLYGYGIGAYSGSVGSLTLNATTAADLAAMTIIPQTPIYFSGQKLGNAIESYIATNCPNTVFRVCPNGVMRFLDLRTFNDVSVTWGTDAVLPPPLSMDTCDCYSRVVINGAPVAQMFAFDVAIGGLSEAPFAHDGLTIAQAKTKWVPGDWLNPAYSPGRATASASTSAGALVSITPGQAGYGYTAGTVGVTVTGGSGSGATAYATAAGGVITGYTVTAGGTGYTTTPTITVAPPSGPGRDSGTCTCPSTTTITVTSANATSLWPSNFWDQSHREGQIFVTYSALTSFTSMQQATIVSNTALTGGGTSTLTVTPPLPNLLFDSYVIVGKNGTASDVWTRYALPSWAATRLAKQSTYPFNYQYSNGQGVSQTSTPIGTVIYGSGSSKQETNVPVRVDQGNGTIVFSQPTYITAGYQTPTNVRALVPIYTGVNYSSYPANSGATPVYSGGLYTAFGTTRTLFVPLPAWRDPANQAAMDAYAQDLWWSVCEPVQEGNVTILGLHNSALAMGDRISISGNGFTTGWESAALPILEAQIDWNSEGVNIVTSFKCSNRRSHYTAEGFLHPDRTGVTWGDSGGIDLSQGYSNLGNYSAHADAVSVSGNEDTMANVFKGSEDTMANTFNQSEADHRTSQGGHNDEFNKILPGFGSSGIDAFADQQGGGGSGE